MRRSEFSSGKNSNKKEMGLKRTIKNKENALKSLDILKKIGKEGAEGYTVNDDEMEEALDKLTKSVEGMD